MKTPAFIENLVSKKILVCLTCDTGHCAWDEFFCPACWKSLGRSFNGRAHLPEFLAGVPLYAAGTYENVWGRWLRILKTQPKDYMPQGFSDFLGQLAQYWAPELQSLNVDAVVYLPGHPLRVFFESQVSRHIAERLAQALRLPVLSEVLIYPGRAWLKLPHKFMGRRLREERLAKEGFRLARLSLRGLRLLVVDDICTTGTSLKSARQVLEENGAEVAAFFVLARVP